MGFFLFQTDQWLDQTLIVFSILGLIHVGSNLDRKTRSPKPRYIGVYRVA